MLIANIIGIVKFVTLIPNPSPKGRRGFKPHTQQNSVIYPLGEGWGEGKPVNITNIIGIVKFVTLIPNPSPKGRRGLKPHSQQNSVIYPLPLGEGWGEGKPVNITNIIGIVKFVTLIPKPSPKGRRGFKP